MNLNENLAKLRNGYIAGKSAFQSDDDRGEEFDATMKEVVDMVRADAYVRFRAMMDAELDEAVRHVRELTWDECCEAVSEQGTVQLPPNRYTKEAVAEREAAQPEQDGEDHA